MSVRPTLLYLAVVCSFVFAASAPAAAETVKLTFAWPQQTRGSVLMTATKTKTAESGSRTTAIDASYDFEAKPVAEGQIISFANPEVAVQSDASATGLQGRLRDFLLRVSNNPPSFVIDKSGHYVRLEGLPAYQANVKAGIEEMLGDVPEDAKAQVRQVLDAALSERQLGTGIVDGWNRDVGAWAGAEMTTGEVYHQQFMTPLPMLGNAQIPMKATYRFVERVSCAQGGGGKDCVVLELRNFVDSGKLGKALEAFLATVAKNSQNQFTVDSLAIDSVVRLVTEPDTLLPHRVDVKKTSTVVITHKGGTQKAREVEEKRLVYSY